jgi:DNA (cytosine-5)-methyltransferase 1
MKLANKLGANESKVRKPTTYQSRLNAESTRVLVSEPQLQIRFKQRETNIGMLNAVSLFSGCGGLDLGFTGGFNSGGRFFPKTKFSINFANDLDSAAEQVYLANRDYLGTHEFLKCDVRNIDVSKIMDFDFLLAGFPCQPFSNAGLRKGINDERGTLFEECERFLEVGLSRKRKPIGFVFENVKGILSSRMPDGKTIPDEIVKRTKRLGFRTVYKLLKASDFGVPTIRERLIIVGLNEKYGPFDFSLLNEVVAEYGLPSESVNPYELYLGSVLADIPRSVAHTTDYWKYSPAGQFMIDKIGPCKDGKEALAGFRKRVPLENISKTITEGRSWKNMKPSEMPARFRKIWDNPQKYRAPNFYRRFALGEISGTIIASAQPENCGITHPFENRRFTIREIARIQSFPDDFVFPYTSIANAYKVIGNAVPPVLAWVIAKALERHLADA